MKTPATPSRRQALSLSLGLGAAFALGGSTRSAAAQAVAPPGAPAQAAAPPGAPAPSRVSALARQALADLEAWCRGRSIDLGASVVELSSGREIAASASLAPKNPASAQKILTIAAALDRLGPGFRFTTSLHGTQSGDALDQLVLRSDGDPELSSSDLMFLVSRLVSFGVRRVRGDLLVDQGAFDSAWEPPAYSQKPDDWAAYRAPVSAVAVDGNTVTLHVRPTEVGTAAHSWLEPQGVGRVDGVVTTTAPDRKENVGLTVVPGTSPVVAKVSGGIPAGRSGIAYAKRLPNPELAAGHVLQALLARAGISVGGRVAAGTSAAPELVRVESRPLAQIVHALGKRSDNFVAEMLLKSLGRAGSTAAGTSLAGAGAIEDFLRARDALTPGTRITNGSGLFDANRLSAFTLARILRVVAADPRLGPELTASLSIAGVDGTLVNRFVKERAARRLRAKTGTLSSVITLAGYLYGPTPLAFAVLMNGLRGGQGEARQRIDGALAPLLDARY